MRELTYRPDREGERSPDDNREEIEDGIRQRFAKRIVSFFCNHKHVDRFNDFGIAVREPVKISLFKVIETEKTDYNYHLMQCDRCKINFTWHVDKITGQVLKTDNLFKGWL